MQGLGASGTGGASEEKLIGQLFEALGSSLDVRTILKEAYPLLTQLVPSDYGALGVSGSSDSAGFEWTVAQLPPAFFASYAQMAAHDFVRSAVARQLRSVLRDEDMVSRADLERNPMYQRARELGSPLEQVMAVMLHLDERWQCGLSLYRDRRRPFSELERARLQRVTPALANAVRNCHAFGVAANWQLALERLLTDSGAAVLASSNGTELGRSNGATALLERWFEPHERRGQRLPASLAACLVGAEAPSWIRRLPGKSLEVSFTRLSGYLGDPRWLLRFAERADGSGVPSPWLSRLTQREAQVVHAVLQGWDNRLIASELGCAEATVKRHLSNIFDKLGLKSRTALVAASAAQQRP